MEQIRELLSIEVFADRKIRTMPDVHAGTGCVIGFTSDFGDKVIPDIGGTVAIDAIINRYLIQGLQIEMCSLKKAL